MKRAALRWLARAAPAAALLGCTAPPEEPPQPALDPGQGWVELTLADSRVPADPVVAGPPECHLLVDLGEQTVLSEPIQPGGSSPPYSVDSTFRFAADPGNHATTVLYSGCRTFKDQLDSREARIPISVQRGRLTRLHFDGSTLRARSPADPSLAGKVW
ncbi:MAG: hypothetical protein QNK04_10690 [Myxococcota bacterium]|nr:hypothetical protein [Myxococcota bacterium]